MLAGRENTEKEAFITLVLSLWSLLLAGGIPAEKATALGPQETLSIELPNLGPPASPFSMAFLFVSFHVLTYPLLVPPSSCHSPWNKSPHGASLKLQTLSVASVFWTDMDFEYSIRNQI